ncbi:hypothetical protein WMY93_012853 [Mugilogobius chulae]|uniref:Uncharacterized protein n=1 Tax=Mugilogobius chulae TaxID=88201 RepID=A0AAW0P2G2_9GOBI
MIRLSALRAWDDHMIRLSALRAWDNMAAVLNHRPIAAMSEVSRELGVENTALAKTIEEIMAKYFRDADEKSEARNNRLEKRLDNMHATLARHTDELKTLRSDTLQLQERVSQTEAHLQHLWTKLQRWKIERGGIICSFSILKKAWKVRI